MINMPDRTDELLAEWRKYAKKRADLLWRFARWTKLVSASRVDRLAREAHQQVFAGLDCMKCANCCRSMNVLLEKPDIKRIAAYLQIDAVEFQVKYLKPNEQGQLEFNAKPCPFLADSGACTIYEVRPKVCAGFPYTDKRNFSSRSWSHGTNVQDCPAVFHILERMQERMGFRG